MSSLHDEAATAISDRSVSSISTTSTTTAAQITESNGSSSSNDSEPIVAASDPFAHDLFAQPSAALVASAATGLSSEEAEHKTEIANKTTVAAWQNALPRCPLEAQQLSAALCEIPLDLADAIKTTLLAALKENLHAANVSLKILDAREVFAPDDFSFNEEALKSGATSNLPTPAKLQCHLAIEPANQIFTLDFNKGFAVSLVDRILGGSGTLAVTREAVSVTELAVLEFLFLTLISRANTTLGEPLLKFAGITQSSASPLESDLQAENMRGRELQFTVRVQADEVQDIVRVRLPSEALAGFSQKRNALLRDNPSVAKNHVTRLLRFKSFLAVKLLLGTTHLRARDAYAIEAGDVLIVSQPAINWNQRRGIGSVFTLLVINEANQTLAARLAAERVDESAKPPQTAKLQATLLKEFAFDESSIIKPLNDEREAATTTTTLRVRVATVETDFEESERLMINDFSETAAMNENLLTGSSSNNNDDEGANNFAAEETTEESANYNSGIENMILALRIELPARHIRLDELASLRTNQILDLQCRPTDTVDITADGRTLARGELVDLEGRLGVRITQVL